MSLLRRTWLLDGKENGPPSRLASRGLFPRTTSGPLVVIGSGDSNPAVSESANYDHILGTTGTSSSPDDLMVIIYDSTRLESLDDFELHRINVTGSVAHCKIR